MTVISPEADATTRWWRDRSAVRPEEAALTSGRNPAHVPVMSAGVTPVVMLALSAVST